MFWSCRDDLGGQGQAVAEMHPLTGGIGAPCRPNLSLSKIHRLRDVHRQLLLRSHFYVAASDPMSSSSAFSISSSLRRGTTWRYGDIGIYSDHTPIGAASSYNVGHFEALYSFAQHERTFDITRIRPPVPAFKCYPLSTQSYHPVSFFMNWRRSQKALTHESKHYLTHSSASSSLIICTPHRTNNQPPSSSS